MSNEVKPTARTRRRVGAQELFALVAANQFWTSYVVEHHEPEEGGTCRLDLDLDELEVELDVFLRKSARRGRQLGATAGGDGALGAVLRAVTGADGELGRIAAAEETWGMTRAYVIAYARNVLNARKE